MSDEAWQSRPGLTAQGARRMLDAAVAEGQRQGLKVSVAVVDAGGVLFAFQRADGAMPASAEVAIGKAASSVYFARPSGELEDVVASRPAFATVPQRIMMRGGLPLRIEGVIAGAIGVSGARPDQDERIAAAGIAALQSES